MSIKPLRSRRFVITFRIGNHAFKLFQIFFSKSSGSLHVNFPYYKHQHGIASVVEILGAPNSIDIGPKGRVTSHRVKYSHHPDGRVHFSQDGRVKSSLRRQAVPLGDIKGHIFTVQLQGIRDFAVKEAAPSSSSRREFVEFDQGSTKAEALKFVGWWYPKDDLVELNPDKTGTPIGLFKKGTGQIVAGAFLSPPSNWPNQDAVCVITCEPMQLITQSSPSILTFIGGFDPPEVADDYSQVMGFLCLIYPVSEENFEQLAEQLGSIDYTPDTIS